MKNGYKQNQILLFMRSSPFRWLKCQCSTLQIK